VSKSKLQGETLWYRLIEGGNAQRYVRLRPRASLADILDESADQALPDKVQGSISKNDRGDPEPKAGHMLDSDITSPTGS
jgi:hypothetical protein